MKYKTQKEGLTVGVVIPAFNEATNLRAVLDTVCAVNWLKQIVVVDDGSTDGTLSIAEQVADHDARVLALRLPENQGKAGAMLAGVRALQTDIVMFLDADLLKISENHLRELYLPFENNECEMTIAVFRRGGLLTDASHRVAPYLTGQRCLRRTEAEEVLMPLAGTRYGVEIGLTVHARRQEWRVRKIIWQGVTHRMKEQKRNGMAGMKSRWQMYRQIMAVVVPTKNNYSFWQYSNGTRRIFR
ncbi:MAG: glycosyltransferase family 2 protein [Anaerolineales bacterium]|nr:glycosyltransferase family 2 protein [Anaerolineales bacterium]